MECKRPLAIIGVHILKYTIIRAFIFLTLILAFAYLSIRLIFFIFADYSWADKLVAFLLLFAEVFGLMHTIGYFLALWSSIVDPKKATSSESDISLEDYPAIAIVVPSYKEPLHILKDTLICFYNLSYPNKHLYLLDDTRYDQAWNTPEKIAEYRKNIEEMCQWLGINLFRRKWRAAKAGIINDFLKFKKGDPLEKLEFHPYQNQSVADEKYIIIFDADMNPFPNFIEPLIAQMEKNPRAAFIQTPQYYSNFETNRVACAAGLEQVIFYEYICENKGLKNSMFCCGSNVLIRIEALNSVGGFDESSVTEDFVTSIKLHLEGWNSIYYNKISAFGLGPEDLGAFFKQQQRWAVGTLGLAIKFPKLFLAHFRKMSLGRWWEYYLSSTYYFTGVFLLIMFICPILFVFLNIPSYFLNKNLYFSFFFPYLVFSLIMTFWTLNLRKYKLKQLIMSMLMAAVSFPIFIKATFTALFNLKTKFVVTPKGKGSSLPLYALWPQLSIIYLNVIAIIWGLEKLYFIGDPFWALVINLCWCTYNLLMISSITYFNNPEGEPWFESAS